MFEQVKGTHALVAEQIKQAVLTGKIKPGERLPPELQMAKIFGVSRVVVREALRTLEAVEIIQKRAGQNGGSFVCLPSVGHLKSSISSMCLLGQCSFGELALVCQLVEPYITELAAQKATAEDLRLLEVSLRRAAELPNGPAKLREMIGFHSLLARICGNRGFALVSDLTVGLITGQVSGHLLPEGHADLVCRMHQEIFEAIKAKDASTARELMLQDMIHATKLAAIASSPPTSNSSDWQSLT
jgi:GntR family transcriptional regulator, transcriptional repressor for pyruvate dehydrogenase complex